MQYPNTEIGAVIRATREARGMTITGLAKLAGVSRRFLVEIEKGANTSIDTLKPIVRLLRITSLPFDGVDVSVTSRSPGVDPEVLLMLVDDLERDLGRTIVELRSLAVTEPKSGGQSATTLIRQVREQAERARSGSAKPAKRRERRA